ncbi:hypothetical protein Bxe_A2194 [Paraburkholderia xenovorans LB400]|uniref:Uncharacterized protein n=1 Tax=Paraburkholderia xenovorans (strain LB400) TaxID=266265 RepID=Q13YR4_PARXL|nr:hypothetical protein Bxe_A2194 [Paraburkholderia xenovorans LB400]
MSWIGWPLPRRPIVSIPEHPPILRKSALRSASLPRRSQRSRKCSGLPVQQDHVLPSQDNKRDVQRRSAQAGRYEALASRFLPDDFRFR